VATYYYGHSGSGRLSGSALGLRCAALLQREIVARTDLLDCRTHPKTWTLLRITRMPAVRLDLGYLSNAADAARLASSEFRDVVADAVAAAVQRLYLPPEHDIPTGQLPIPVGL
jgi:N-acetylmuramoyl-L-alanine amidase